MYKFQRGNIVLYGIILVVILSSMALAFGISPSGPYQTLPPGQIKDENSGSSKSLQLKKLVYATDVPTPILTPIPTQLPCAVDSGNSCKGSCISYLVTCQGGNCTDIINGQFLPEGYLKCTELNNPSSSINQRGGRWCERYDLTGGQDGTFCMAKPVIYLYPQKDIYANVELSIPGKITTSIPKYEKNGWQDVLAHPDGTLLYKNKQYKELFYESEVASVNPPLKGIIIPRGKLAMKLEEYIRRLGLNDTETQEFLDYWLPELKKLNSNYILFSVLDAEEKERVDRVVISPEPNTFIQFIAYFKPLDFPTAVEPLILPPAPSRIGFTAVEWGGTIDSQQNNKLF